MEMEIINGTHKVKTLKITSANRKIKNLKVNLPIVSEKLSFPRSPILKANRPKDFLPLKNIIGMIYRTIIVLKMIPDGGSFTLVISF